MKYGTRIAIDPSVNHLAISVWSPEGMLIAALLVYPDGEGAGGTRFNRLVDGLMYAEFEDGGIVYHHIDCAKEVVCEMPMIYPNSTQWKGSPNDLLKLARVVGLLEHRFASRGFRAVLPREWKGTMSKGQAFEDKVRGRLSKDELHNIELPSAKGDDHNVWDAVGIGLWMCGRFDKKRVLHREATRSSKRKRRAEDLVRNAGKPRAIRKKKGRFSS